MTDPSGLFGMGGMAMSISIGAGIGAAVGGYRHGVNGAIVGAFAGGAAGALAISMPVFGGTFTKMLASGVLTGFATGTLNGFIYNTLLDHNGDLNLSISRGTFQGFKEGVYGALFGAGLGVAGAGILTAGAYLGSQSPLIKAAIVECIAAAQSLKCPITKQQLLRFDLNKFLSKNSQWKGDIGESIDRWSHSALDWIGDAKYNALNGGDNVFYSAGTDRVLLSEAKWVSGWNSTRKTCDSLLNKAYGDYKQMSDGWVRAVIGRLKTNGIEMGDQLESAMRNGTLDKSVTVINEYGDTFLYRHTNGKWRLVE